jgi:hypothetical protein
VLGDGRHSPWLAGRRWREPREADPHLGAKSRLEHLRDGDEPIAEGSRAAPRDAISTTGQVGLAVHLKVAHASPDECLHGRGEGVHECLRRGRVLGRPWAEQLDQEGVDANVAVGDQVGGRVDDGPQFERLQAGLADGVEAGRSDRAVPDQ